MVDELCCYAHRQWVNCYTIFDTKQDHYQVMNVGRDGYRRVYGCVLHLDIKKGKT
ncbi:element excision factor XisI family protein [Trichormus azollae]|uniref:element excision factor XisI family protein n=1 Tax=Trichormus azollae TaxID=1164 RepID=UPI003B830646